MDPKTLVDHFLDVLKNHYFDMNGRVGRPGFWYFILGCFVVQLIAMILSPVTLGLLSPIVSLALLLPTAGMAARRLQDTGRNGQLVWVYVAASVFYSLLGLAIVGTGPFGALGFLYFFLTIGWLINIVFLIVAIAIIYFCCQPGDPAPNAYGPVPPVFDPSKPASAPL
jgi:uncharacterized membrane protein YhaH (DUF805 family)